MKILVITIYYLISIATSSNNFEIGVSQTEYFAKKQLLENNHPYYRVVDDIYVTDIPFEWQDYLYEKCVEYDMIDKYELLLAQIYVESKFNPKAISKTNDYGLMQINKKYHDYISELTGVDDFLDPYESMDAGCYLMHKYYNEYPIETALVAYNSGVGKIKKGVTKTKYSDHVIGTLDKLSEIKVY